MCCVFYILNPLALQKAHFNFSYGICETLVTKIKKPQRISYFNMGLSFSLTANSWLHVKCSRNPLDLSDMIKAAGFQQHQLPYLFAHLLCVPCWFCTPVGCDVLKIWYIYKSFIFFSEPATCRTGPLTLTKAFLKWVLFYTDRCLKSEIIFILPLPKIHSFRVKRIY